MDDFDPDDILDEDFDLEDFEDDFDSDFDDEELGDESWDNYDDDSTDAVDPPVTGGVAPAAPIEEPEDFDEFPEDLEDEFPEQVEGIADSKNFVQKNFFAIVGGVIVVVGAGLFFLMSGGDKADSGFDDMAALEQPAMEKDLPPVPEEPKQAEFVQAVENEEPLAHDSLTPMPAFSSFEESKPEPVKAKKKIEAKSVPVATALSQEDLDKLLEPVSKQAEELKKDLESSLKNLEGNDRTFERDLSKVEKDLSSKIMQTERKLDRALSTIDALEKRLAEATKQADDAAKQAEKYAAEARSAKAKAETEAKKAAAAPKKAEPKKPEPVLRSRSETSSNTTRAAATPPSWMLRSAQPGKAVIADRNSQNVLTVRIGDRVEGLGKVTSIAIINGRWMVSGTEASIGQ